ncbi:MAG TPA: VTT domain-containing protein [Candidatus Babeliales bacterium]|nr:VTT domain-containing protein [Candidatus Babeliales bacterium]
MKVSGKQIFFVLAIVALVLFVQFSGVRSWFTIESLKTHKDSLMQVVQTNYFFAVLLYIGIFAAIVMSLVPFTPLATIASGSLFGTVGGIIYTLIGGLLGSTIALLLFRYVFRDFMLARHSAQFDKFQAEFKSHGMSYLLSLVLFPITPFSVIIILAGLSDIALWKFLCAIGLGMLPSTVLYAYTGQQIATIESARDILSWQFILLFSALGVLSLLPVIVGKIKKLFGK